MNLPADAMEFSLLNKANFDKDCLYTANSEFYNSGANGGGLSVANHINHYNLMIDSSYKLCANESAIRGSLNQESSLLFSKITTVSEFYPATHNIGSYNTGKYSGHQFHLQPVHLDGSIMDCNLEPTLTSP